jgi:hypothetical protein
MGVFYCLIAAHHFYVIPISVMHQKTQIAVLLSSLTVSVKNIRANKKKHDSVLESHDIK